MDLYSVLALKKSVSIQRVEYVVCEGKVASAAGV